MRTLYCGTILTALMAACSTPTKYQQVAELPEDKGLHRIVTEDGVCYVFTDDDYFGAMQCDFNRGKGKVDAASRTVTNTNHNTNENVVHVYTTPGASAGSPLPPTIKAGPTLTETPYGGYGEDKETGKVYSYIKTK